jgi:hypothetical protein
MTNCPKHSHVLVKQLILLELINVILIDREARQFLNWVYRFLVENHKIRWICKFAFACTLITSSFIKKFVPP